MLFRVRVKFDIKNFPDADVFEDDSADYKYRAFILKAKVAVKMMFKIKDIKYDNFKNSVIEIERKMPILRNWQI